MPARCLPVLPGQLHLTRPLAVRGLRGERRCTLYLPPGYHDAPTRRYPVAYLFDGQNLFGDAGSFAGGWHLHHLLDARAAAGKLTPIVVGIHHGGAHRTEDLSPWRLGRGQEGRFEALLDWLLRELRPLIQSELRGLEGPGDTLIGGASLGGLAALYAQFKHPDVFGRALVMSPSLWVNRAGMAQLAYQARWTAEMRLYLDAGGREMGGQALRDARRMAEQLVARGLEPGVQLMWRPDRRGAHNERNWARRLPKALRFLYDGARR
ncbi:MAG: alpha/beta hydrolase-fold protein [Candidatus Sericytochromatia bacterium]|nr:alpha/beta hydrolase-fold protein [Candidatus Sericytochromatia bacterium]